MHATAISMTMCLESADNRSVLAKPQHTLPAWPCVATHVSTAVTASHVEVVQQGPAASINHPAVSCRRATQECLPLALHPTTPRPPQASLSLRGEAHLPEYNCHVELAQYTVVAALCV